MNIYSFKLSNLSVSLYQVNKDNPCDFHKHDKYYQVCLPLDQNIFLGHRTDQRMMNPENRIVIGPGEVHRKFTNHSEGHMYIVNIEEEYLLNVFNEVTESTNKTIEFEMWNVGCNSSLMTSVEEMTKAMMHNPFDVTLLEEYQWDIVVNLLSIQNGTHSENWLNPRYKLKCPSINLALDFMHENFRHSISLEELVKASNVSKSYLIKSFKQVTGFTPHQYLLNIRLDYTKRLLMETKLSITSIAMDAGFGSFSTFERVFKKRFNVNPKTYRKKI